MGIKALMDSAELYGKKRSISPPGLKAGFPKTGKRSTILWFSLPC